MTRRRSGALAAFVLASIAGIGGLAAQSIYTRNYPDAPGFRCLTLPRHRQTFVPLPTVEESALGGAAGPAAQARAVLRLAAHSADEIPEASCAVTVRAIAVRLGRVDDANTALSLIDHTPLWGQVYPWEGAALVAKAQLAAGDPDGALRTSGSVSERVVPFELADVAIELARRGRARDADVLAERLHEPAFRLAALKDIRTVTSDHTGAEPYRAIDTTIEGAPEARARAGDVAGAVALAMALPDDTTRADGLRRVVAVLADGRNFADARRIAAGIRNDRLRDGAWLRVAAAQADAGDVTAAIEAINQVRDGAMQAAGVERVTRAWAHGGDTAGALAWARALPMPLSRARALVGIADGILERRR